MLDGGQHWCCGMICFPGGCPKWGAGGAAGVVPRAGGRPAGGTPPAVQRRTGRAQCVLHAGVRRSKLPQRPLPMTWPCASNTADQRTPDWAGECGHTAYELPLGASRAAWASERILAHLQAAVSGAAASNEGRDGRARNPREARSRRWPAMQKAASLSSPLPSALQKPQVSSVPFPLLEICQGKLIGRVWQLAHIQLLTAGQALHLMMTHAPAIWATVDNIDLPD